MSIYLLPAWGRHTHTHTRARAHTHTQVPSSWGTASIWECPQASEAAGVLGSHGLPRLPSLPFPHNPRWGPAPTLSSAWLSPINAAERNKAPHTGMGVAPAQAGPRAPAPSFLVSVPPNQSRTSTCIHTDRQD